MPAEAGPRITVTKDGPYRVTHGVPLAEQHIVMNEAGESIEWREGKQYAPPAEYLLCRCGQSGHKPFCDMSHRRVEFNGTETASREPFNDQAEVIDGPVLSLKDAPPLCAFARFCDPNGQVWGLVKKTDEREARIQFLNEVGQCPAGRLVAVDNATGADLEPRLEPSIGLVEDPRGPVMGPLWVRGGIPVIAADGHAYQVRNRAALCRCGRSATKPYCDGSHAAEASA
jgi:CDGSH-type Zn-finger protein